MKYVGIDIEAIGLNPFGGVIWMVSRTEGKKTWLIHDCNGILKPPTDLRKLLEDESVCKIIHSSQYDCPYMELTWGCKTRNIWDTELSETVILGLKLNIKRKTIQKGSYEEKLLKQFGTSLDLVLPRYKFPSIDKSIRANYIDRPKGKPFTKVEIDYPKKDTMYLPALQKAQEYILTRDDQLEVALLENKVSERYHDMRVRGIGFDKTIWRDTYDYTEKKFKQRISKLPKEVHNWNSPAQVKDYFKRKGIAIPSFDDLDRVYLKTRNTILGDFIASREYTTALSRYGLDWFTRGYIDPDGRIRSDINQIINTARNSFSNPNLQQLPGSGNSDPLRIKVVKLVTGGDKEKFKHRAAFIPKPGHVFVIGDFSGQEIGIMAAASNERLWIDAMLRGEDVHGLTASIIDLTQWAHAREKGCTFPKKCRCEGHKALREPAKINNFRLAYGGGVASFATYMGWEDLDASVYLGKHKRVIPNLTKYLEKNGQDALATGISYSADPYRRRRVLMGEEGWQVRNQGKNNPIQTAGANLLKLSLVSLPWKYAVVLVIHDEIIIEVPIKQAVESAAVLKSVMERSADYVCGIKGLIQTTPKIQTNIMKDLPVCKNMNGIKSGEFCFEPKL